MSEQLDDPLLSKTPIDLPEVKPPGFDIEKYMEMAKDFDMSEEEKHELLAILWDIMRRFVELGFGLDSVSILGSVISQNDSDDTGCMVENKDNQKTE